MILSYKKKVMYKISNSQAKEKRLYHLYNIPGFISSWIVKQFV